MMSFKCSTLTDHPDISADVVKRRTKNSARNRSRSGLAPVELVLSIPILLMVMALMVTFGTAACWKIRSETVSRDAAWRSRWPRPNYFQPRPDSWPDSAAMTVQGGEDVEALDNEAIELPVVAGPLGPVEVNERLLDFSRGVQVGTSRVEQRPAMLRTLDSIQFRVGSPIIDNKFQYRQMGLSSNGRRRMPLIYEMPESPGLSSRYDQAVSAIRNSPVRDAWRVLDNDDELRAYFRHRIDFHPRLRGFCELDIERVQEEQVQPLISRIEGVPRNMTRTFIRMYEDLLEREPPIPASTRAQIEAKLEQLRSFEERLDELEAENEDRNALNGVSSDDISELAQAKLNS